MIVVLDFNMRSVVRAHPLAFPLFFSFRANPVRGHEREKNVMVQRTLESSSYLRHELIRAAHTRNFVSVRELLDKSLNGGVVLHEGNVGGIAR